LPIAAEDGFFLSLEGYSIFVPSLRSGNSELLL
jgi:hypothetical protein